MIELSGLLTTETKPLMILDNACGGSALATFTMFDLLSEETMQEVQIVATDKSSNAVGAATRKLGESQYPDHVMTLKMDMQDLDGLGEKEFDYEFTNFSINLAKDNEAILKGLHRGLKAGGICAFTVWKRLEWLDILRQAFTQHLPQAPAFPKHDASLLQFSHNNAWHDSAWIERQLASAGFEDVQIELLPTKHRFTREEFMDNFGSVVVEYLMRNAWGPETAKKHTEAAREAIWRFVDDKAQLVPTGQEDDDPAEPILELELDALVVIARKGAPSVPVAM